MFNPDSVDGAMEPGVVGTTGSTDVTPTDVMSSVLLEDADLALALSLQVGMCDVCARACVCVYAFFSV